MRSIHAHNDSFDDAEISGEGRVVRDLHRLTSLVERFEPVAANNGEDWTFHLRPDGAWVRFDVRREGGAWYCTLSMIPKKWSFEPDIERFSCADGDVQVYGPPTPRAAAMVPALAAELDRVLREVSVDPIKYNGDLAKHLPPTMRFGMIPRSFVRELIPEWLPLQRELTAEETSRMCTICDRPDGEPVPRMTSRRFFELCRVAYRANAHIFEAHDGAFDRTASGRTMYLKRADGRDGGLRDIPPHSVEAFEKWFDGAGRAGAHPWEIYRGGNSTHIDLNISRAPLEDGSSGWRVTLDAPSTTRLAELARIAIAFDDAGIPFTLADKESLAKRLRGEDFIGIAPIFERLKYAHYLFPEEYSVADVLHFEWFKDSRGGRPLRPWREIAAVTTWLPVPLVRARPT